MFSLKQYKWASGVQKAPQQREERRQSRNTDHLSGTYEVPAQQ